MSAKPVVAAGVDAGSSRTRCVALVLEDSRVRLIGFGEAPSQAWKKGRVADQNALADSILRAVRDAEARAQINIASAVMGVGGAGICGANGRGGYELGFPRQIDQADINRVIERASRVQLQEDEMLLHLMPQGFTVDGRAGNRNPRGMIGSRLEAYVYLVTTSLSEHHALIGAANQAHLSVEETAFEPLAAAYASILPEDREDGVALVDIGAHSTELVVFYGEALLFTASLPICGDHFTRDIARGLYVSLDDAEWIKQQHGCAILGLTSDSSLLELPSSSARGPRETTRRELNLILEARATELFEYVRREVARAGMEQALISVALAGGGARLQGMCDVAESVLKCQARIGLPIGILDWTADIDNPAWTTAAGLAMYSARLKLRSELERKNAGFLSRVLGA